MNRGARDFAATLKKRRIPQRTAAQVLGITEGHVSHLIRGSRTPSYALAALIESTYGVKMMAWGVDARAV